MTSPTPDPDPQAPKRRRAKTRPALIAAGERLLAQRPIDSLSVDEIVEAAGVAKGSFFYHFPDKQSFARQIAADIRLEVEAAIAKANLDIEDPAKRVAQGVAQFILFALTSPGRVTIILTGDRRASDPDHALNSGLRADLERGLKTNRFDFGDLEGAMLNLIGVTNLLLGKILFDRLDPPAAGKLYVDALAFAFRGLGVSPQESRALLEAVAQDTFARAPTS